MWGEQSAVVTLHKLGVYVDIESELQQLMTEGSRARSGWVTVCMLVVPLGQAAGGIGKT